jgi:hypothetical protein
MTTHKGGNPDSGDQCGCTTLYEFLQRIEDMVFGTVLFVAFVVATGTAIVKAFEWHQELLYGPYLKAERGTDPGCGWD